MRMSSHARTLPRDFVVIARLAPHFDEHVVQQILRLAPIAEDAATDGQQRRRVTVVQSRQAIAIATRGPADQAHIALVNHADPPSFCDIRR